MRGEKMRWWTSHTAALSFTVEGSRAAVHNSFRQNHKTKPLLQGGNWWLKLDDSVRIKLLLLCFWRYESPSGPLILPLQDLLLCVHVLIKQDWEQANFKDLRISKQKGSIWVPLLRASGLLGCAAVEVAWVHVCSSSPRTHTATGICVRIISSHVKLLENIYINCWFFYFSFMYCSLYDMLPPLCYICTKCRNIGWRENL